VDFSIVVPTCERPASLGELLAALARLDYARERFEVIVVDDGGRQPMESLLEPFRSSLNVTLLRQENVGPGGARNRGAARAMGRTLAFTDDDCRPDPGWLRAWAAAVAREPRAVFGGLTLNAYPENPFSTATHTLADYVAKHYSPGETAGGFFPALNMAVPRDAFLEIGGFDAALRFGEDRDFCYRWASAGGAFVYESAAIVQHAHALNLGSFLRLHYRYGTGTGRFRRGCPRKGLPAPEFRPPAWYLRLVLSGGRGRRFLPAVSQMGLLAISQAATAAGIVCGALACGAAETRDP
jgi:GT2 family glycosyltransferase